MLPIAGECACVCCVVGVVVLLIKRRLAGDKLAGYFGEGECRRGVYINKNSRFQLSFVWYPELTGGVMRSLN